MKGRHVVILVFVFGLSLMAILFRVLPHAKPAPAPPPPPAPPMVDKAPPQRLPPPGIESAGAIEVAVLSKGAPVSGATVSIQALKGEGIHLLSSDDKGECRVPSAAPGEWRIVARSEGVAAAVATVTVATGRSSRVVLDLAAGVRLQGTVLDSAGAPVPGAKVAMSLPDPAFTARTDAVGRYVIQDLPVGVHAVTASSDRLRPHTITNLELTTPGQTFTQNFTLSFGSTVTGRVVDDTGAPVGRATITVSNEVARVTRSDENGEFRVDGLGESPVAISVAARGFATVHKRRVALGGAPLTLELLRGAVVTGRVDGNPEAFTVHLSLFDAELSRWIVVRSLPFSGEGNGAFQVGDLAPGQYELSVETEDRRSPAPKALVLETGQTVDAGVIVLAGK